MTPQQNLMRAIICQAMKDSDNPDYLEDVKNWSRTKACKKICEYADVEYDEVKIYLENL